MDDIQQRARAWLSCHDTVADAGHLLGATKDVWSSGAIRTSVDDGIQNLKQLNNIRDVTSVAVGWAAGIATFQAGLWLSVRGCRTIRISSAQRFATVAGLLMVPTCGIIAGHTMQFASAEFSARVYGQLASPLLQRSHLNNTNNDAIPSSTTRRSSSLSNRHPGPQWRQHALTRYENVFYGVAALVMFRLAGGRFRFVAPSDIARVGSFATKSLPARYNILCDAGEKAKLLAIGTRDGCHHCGTRHGLAFWRRGAGIDWIGDHMPPNKYASYGHTQRFYPQCSSCATTQSAAVRYDKRTLVAPRTLRMYHAWLPFPIIWLAMVPATYTLHYEYERRKRAAAVAPTVSSSHTKVTKP